MTAKSNAAAKLEGELIVTRTLDATPETVYKAWTDPEQMARWWGPNCFTNPVCELDVRPGGTWRVVMRAPDGVEYECGGIYREVVAAQRLVFTNNALTARARYCWKASPRLRSLLRAQKQNLRWKLTWSEKFLTPHRCWPEWM